MNGLTSSEDFKYLIITQNGPQELWRVDEKGTLYAGPGEVELVKQSLQKLGHTHDALYVQADAFGIVCLIAALAVGFGFAVGRTWRW